jgi:hypothetical protein
MPKVILTATTDAAQSDEVVVSEGLCTMPAHFTAPGLVDDEVATLQKKTAAGGWNDYYVDDTVQTVTATNSGLAVYAPGIYRLDKDETAAAVPCEVSTEADQ